MEARRAKIENMIIAPPAVHYEGLVLVTTQDLFLSHLFESIFLVLVTTQDNTGCIT